MESGGGGGGGEQVDAPPRTDVDVEANISRAMRARLSDFKDRADSLTFEGVRRALEKDLGMEAFSLDAHKRFIRKCLEEFFYGADDENVPKSSGIAVEESVQPIEEERQPEDNRSPNNSFGMDEKAMELPSLVRKETAEERSDKNECLESNNNLSEDIIKKAIKKRASYLKDNAEEISFSGLRRLLEEDLKVGKFSLDAYKGFIKQEIDEVFNSPEVVKGSNGVKNKSLKTTSRTVDAEKMGKRSKKATKDIDSSDSDGNLSVDGEVDKEIKGSKKRVARKIKASAEHSKKRRKLVEESKPSTSRKNKPTGPDLEKSTVTESGNSSDEDHSHSSAEEGKKKRKDLPTQAYGKQVEHLKSIIKSCGVSIPPAVYKRAKQAPESKREAYLIKELEEILEREGLSPNPSEKEIKAVRKNKERAKELEGIDLSNIVTSSRRRSTSSYLPPPKPKVQVESENNDDEDDDNEDDDENEEDSDGGNATDGSDEDDESE